MMVGHGELLGLMVGQGELLALIIGHGELLGLMVGQGELLALIVGQGELLGLMTAVLLLGRKWVCVPTVEDSIIMLLSGWWVSRIMANGPRVARHSSILFSTR
jgi:hypothetical protein